MRTAISASVWFLSGVLLALNAGAELPHEDSWLEHAEHDLARFWLREPLAGTPEGSFPTFVCADGSVWNPNGPCPSISNAGEWIKKELGRQYVRMVSRQVYTYGAIYHLTGDERALELAGAGTRYILETAFDPGSGSVATFLVDAKPGLEPAQRTTQSLAYAALGPAFYYYLTRDEAVLDYVLAVKQHVFSQYWSDDWKMLKWTVESTGHDLNTRKELVAQLDQINAYMLLMLALVPDTERESWAEDIRRLVEVMLRDFHDPDKHRFYGNLHDPEGKKWGQQHNDFGHTAKAYWMIYLAGRHLGEKSWVRLARRGLDDVFADAMVKRNIGDAPDWQAPVMQRAADANGDYFLWSNASDGIGIGYWEWCELDQAAATLAMEDSRYAGYLEKAYPVWLETMVDKDAGGTYGFNGAAGGAKAHHWQNGYHPAEHALVAYITTAVMNKRPLRLYFALPEASANAKVSAYYFNVPELSRRVLHSLPERRAAVEVRFGASGLASR